MNLFHGGLYRLKNLIILNVPSISVHVVFLIIICDPYLHVHGDQLIAILSDSISIAVNLQIQSPNIF